jgi:hypothetical protein
MCQKGKKRLFGWGEADFDRLVGFVGGRFPFPLADGVGGSLGENGMTAIYIQSFDGTVRGDDGVDFDDFSKAMVRANAG